jgi:hypothetical protein
MQNQYLGTPLGMHDRRLHTKDLVLGDALLHHGHATRDIHAPNHTLVHTKDSVRIVDSF